jgi:hypothetical protein
MIDESSLDGSGWALFSDDRRFRYRLRRTLGAVPLGGMLGDFRAVTFLMINPSTATAFKPDPTISRCIEFARRWGATRLEVANLFAFISPYPKDLIARAVADRRDEDVNDQQIIAACSNAFRVIAAWGRNGVIDGRADRVLRILRERAIKLECLGTSKDGSPVHPLARGKSFVPYDREPVPFGGTS